MAQARKEELEERKAEASARAAESKKAFEAKYGTAKIPKKRTEDSLAAAARADKRRGTIEPSEIKQRSAPSELVLAKPSATGARARANRARALRGTCSMLRARRA